MLSGTIYVVSGSASYDGFYFTDFYVNACTTEKAAQNKVKRMQRNEKCEDYDRYETVIYSYEAVNLVC